MADRGAKAVADACEADRKLVEAIREADQARYEKLKQRVDWLGMLVTQAWKVSKLFVAAPA